MRQSERPHSKLAGQGNATFACATFFRTLSSSASPRDMMVASSTTREVSSGHRAAQGDGGAYLRWPAALPAALES
eukprot:1339141-Rhodomonas_salina.1